MRHDPFNLGTPDRDRVASDRVQCHIDKLVTYFSADEARDFAERGEPDSHIYHSVQAVDAWLRDANKRLSQRTLYLVSLIYGSDEPPLLITADPCEAVEFARRLAADPLSVPQAAREHAALGKGPDEPICVRVYRFAAGCQVACESFECAATESGVSRA